MQPALQLVSQVLGSQHPATWVWADVRKLRPVEDARGATGSRLTWKFCTSPDHEVDSASLTGLVREWIEFVDICKSGFDTTGYVCEILKQTIEWNIQSQFRVSPADGAQSGNSDKRSYGSTLIERTQGVSPGSPFKIRISIAADIIWPLLVDEYSPAEKAATTLMVAGTMLHEISVRLHMNITSSYEEALIATYADQMR